MLAEFLQAEIQCQRGFVGYSCKSPTKDHSLSETPSSFIQHVNERSLLLNSSVYFRTHSAPVGVISSIKNRKKMSWSLMASNSWKKLSDNDQKNKKR